MLASCLCHHNHLGKVGHLANVPDCRFHATAVTVTSSSTILIRMVLLAGQKLSVCFATALLAAWLYLQPWAASGYRGSCNDAYRRRLFFLVVPSLRMLPKVTVPATCVCCAVDVSL